jgi:hypothetical protein
VTRTHVLALALVANACTGVPREEVETKYDQGTGKLSQIAIHSPRDGKPDIISYMDGTRFLRIEVDQNEDGRIDRWEYYSDDQKLEKVGFSRAGDGVVDAWAFKAQDGSIGRVEVSTRRDGRANRVEIYEKGTLKEAQEDTDGDGRMDKWETYASGRLVKVGFDPASKGEPTYVIDYGNDTAGK